MKAMTQKKTLLIFMAVLLLATANLAAAESLFEYYTDASAERLSAETSDMGKNLRTVFSDGSVKKQQQKIDFAEYFSSLEKTALFASRLATYSEYEADLRFARDNEVFKGLPEDNPAGNNGPALDRKDFVRSKYGRMKKNIEEEIDTYNDLILMSLDTCETLTSNDLSDILGNEAFQQKINRFMQSRDYQEYRTKRSRFGERWRGLESRISAQFAAWQPRPPSADDPIIDPKIVGAI